jgi:hypothetical protein
MEKNNLPNDFSQFFSIICLIALLAVAQINEAKAQDDTANDPLKKPNIWKQLKENPSDLKLWESYAGKPWEQMTQKQQSDINAWRQDLMMQQLENDDIVITSSVEKDKNEGSNEVIALSKMEMEDLTVEDMKNAELLIMQENDDVVELKQNIDQNFILLEDMYQDMFAEYGLEYVSYFEEHPNGSYPKTSWVKEQEDRLNKVKMERVRELKAKLIKGN